MKLPKIGGIDTITIEGILNLTDLEKESKDYDEAILSLIVQLPREKQFRYISKLSIRGQLEFCKTLSKEEIEEVISERLVKPLVIAALEHDSEKIISISKEIMDSNKLKIATIPEIIREIISNEDNPITLKFKSASDVTSFIDQIFKDREEGEYYSILAAAGEHKALDEQIGRVMESIGDEEKIPAKYERFIHDAIAYEEAVRGTSSIEQYFDKYEKLYPIEYRYSKESLKRSKLHERVLDTHKIEPEDNCTMMLRHLEVMAKYLLNPEYMTETTKKDFLTAHEAIIRAFVEKSNTMPSFYTEDQSRDIEEFFRGETVRVNEDTKRWEKKRIFEEAMKRRKVLRTELDGAKRRNEEARKAANKQSITHNP